MSNPIEAYRLALLARPHADDPVLLDAAQSANIGHDMLLADLRVASELLRFQAEARNLDTLRETAANVSHEVDVFLASHNAQRLQQTDETREATQRKSDAVLAWHRARDAACRVTHLLADLNSRMAIHSTRPTMAGGVKT